VSLDIHKLCVTYNETSVLHDVSAKLPAGQVTALIGCNGAGKSTMLKAMAGLLPMSGQMILDTHVLTGAQKLKSIAYMPQETSAGSSLTVLEVILLGRIGSLGMFVSTSLIDEAYQALDTFGLTSIQARTLDAISGGQRQMVYLAQAMFRCPRVLLLDEPTAALDLRHQLLVLETLRKFADETGGVVGMAMHDLSLAAQFSDRVIGLKDGRVLASGKPPEVITAKHLCEMYAIDAEIHMTSRGHIQVVPLRAAV